MRRPLRPSDIQPADDPTRLTAERSERRIAVALYRALRAINGSVTRDQVLALLRGYEVTKGLASFVATIGATARAYLDRVSSVLSLDFVSRELADTMDGMATIYGASAASALPGATFDRYHPDAVADIQASRQRLTDAVVDTSRESVAHILADGIAAGDTLEDMASAIARTMGLTPQQARAVENYRKALESGTNAALTRRLRDRRFDNAVRAASKREPLTKEQVDRMVERYIDRMLRHRAETIAKTETLRTAVEGKRAAWRQLVEAGEARESEIRRFWLTAGDELVCEVCSAIPGMNQMGVMMDEPYSTPKGPMMGPLAHPRCRCTERIVKV